MCPFVFHSIGCVLADTCRLTRVVKRGGKVFHILDAQSVQELEMHLRVSVYEFHHKEGKAERGHPCNNTILIGPIPSQIRFASALHRQGCNGHKETSSTPPRTLSLHGTGHTLRESWSSQVPQSVQSHQRYNAMRPPCTEHIRTYHTRFLVHCRRHSVLDDLDPYALGQVLTHTHAHTHAHKHTHQLVREAL